MGDREQTNSVAPKPASGRIEWVDVLRGLAIYCVYLGHFSANLGRIPAFVSVFHVPLFFFVSGCSAAVSKRKKTLWEEWKGNLLQVFFPYIFMVLVCGVVEALFYDLGQHDFWTQFLSCFTGVGTPFFMGSAWFFPCLFLLKTVFSMIERAVQPPKVRAVLYPVLGLAGFLLCYSTDHPLFYNINNIPYWMLFYHCGYRLFPAIERVRRREVRIPDGRRFLLAALAALSSVYFSTVFFGKEYLVSLLPEGSVPARLVTVLHAFLGIFHMLMLSLLLDQSRILQKIGRNTLFLCGCEPQIWRVTETFLKQIHMVPGGINPLMASIYVFGILAAAAYWIVAPVRLLWFRVRDVLFPMKQVDTAAPVKSASAFQFPIQKIYNVLISDEKGTHTNAHAHR